MKKVLRGIYYFFAGIKNSFLDFCEWYTGNLGVPGIFRNRATLAVIAVVIVGSAGALIWTAAHMDGGRELPVVQESVAEPSSVPEPSSQAPESASEPASSSEPAIDAMASATRFAPVTAEQLTTELTARTKKYYETAAASGVIFTPPPAGDIAAWKAVNSDTIGWLTVSNTNINYAVLKGPYTDYYTHKGYSKEPSRNGVIWVDSDTKLAADGSITSQNTIIYGHNWTNCWRPVRIGNPGDIMLAQLAAYDDASFAAANPYIRLATADGDHMYQVFSVFYARPTEFAYYYADGARVPGIITQAKKMSIHQFGVPVSGNDKIITFSTCTRIMGAGDNQRFVVMAKKIS